ncbi:MAG: hypothetical protein D8M57_17065 [Candidatus Scalindua sp. AMX11]|nr:MAG: hypothetical protein DWQ00_12510 [Candidatus Scalindua sp.]NOG84061.1 hypothetical protein [Planctomycetota bacterium]RZV67436.1 MAG: hypothetical protein EX341_17015 [Candidatus Scalindua sp. SCAELEC01]TDE63681.1 MAG: hypothetical protein D8M57_17065 [Candidatus Scalindua sp. AMX11]GJQ60560.1 MAG: hypothetical protein SCALA701_33610 [Candidatus Scalindua sp.]
MLHVSVYEKKLDNNKQDSIIGAAQCEPLFSIVDYAMNPFKLKQKLKHKKITTLVAIPYIILCITSGGLHSFDKGAYHAHHDGGVSINEEAEWDGCHSHFIKNEPSLCYNDHSADKCNICRWLKGTTTRIQCVKKQSSFFEDFRRLFIIDNTACNFLEIHTHSPRSPPFHIS